jgi:NTP pyrophosphatase (non-canonical NTP hydrolase)
MRLEAAREIAVGRLVDHLGQRLGDLLFGVIDVLQLMEEQIVHRLDVLAEDSHAVS